MKKLIILDIDNVLNNTSFHDKWMKEHADMGTRNWLESKFQSLFYYVSENRFYNGYLVPENLNNFNEIIDETGADIVVSSDWRYVQDGFYKTVETINSLQELFKYRGIKGKIIGTTPHVRDYDRSTEILRWLLHNDIKDTRVLILDDIDVKDVVTAMKERWGFKDIKFLRMNYKTGLTKEDKEESIKWLNEEVE